MKKILVLILGLTLFQVQAQDPTPAKMPAPTVTAGLDAEYGYNILMENTDNLFKTDAFQTPVGAFLPYGPRVNLFKVAPWVAMDWSLMNIKAESVYDAYRNNKDDWALVRLTSTWKDLFGFSIQSISEWKNEKVDPNNTTDDPQAILGANTHTLTATLDRLKENGVKFHLIYNAANILDILTTDFGYNVDDLVNGFTEIGTELDTEFLAGKVIYKPSEALANRWDTVWVEARKLFGIWTVRMNDSAEMALRIPGPDTDVTIDRTDFGIGWENEAAEIGEQIAKNTGHMNVLNTFTPLEGLKIQVAKVVPASQTTLANWLRDQKMSLGASFAVAKLGTFGAGTLLGMDYLTTDATGSVKGPTLLFAQRTAGVSSALWGTAVWFDANLDPLVGIGSTLFTSAEVRFGQYLNVNETNTSIAALPANTIGELKAGGLTKATVQGEYGAAFGAIGLQAALRFTLGLGYDYQKDLGISFADHLTAVKANVANYVADSYNEGAYSNNYMTLTPFELKIRGTYTFNPENKVWIQNNFIANNVNMGTDFTAAETSGDLNGVAANVRTVYGFASTDTIELGYEVKANKASTLSFAAGYNLYLGLPTASQVYADGLADNLKPGVDAALATFYSTKYNPWTLKATYTFKY